MKKGFALLLLLCLMTIFSCGCAEEAPDYYGIGMDVVKVMDEVLQSRDYLEMYLPNTEVLDMIDSRYNTHDYENPVAVYRLNQNDAHKWLLSQLPEKDLEKLNALSPSLQDQIWSRIEGLSYFVSMFNSKKGVEVISASSVLFVQLKKPELELEKTEYCLFVFESGVPILVSYGWHFATGQVLALDSSETESAETLQSVLEPWGIEVSLLEMP